MSLSPIPLKLFRTEDPVTRVANEREYAVLKGAQEVFYYPFPTSGSANASVNTINCNPTSQRTIIDRKLYVKAKFTMLMTGVNNSGTTSGLLVPGHDGLRSYPLAKVTKNVQVQLGDQSVSTNLNEYFSAIERYSFDTDLQNFEFSGTPAMPDQYTNYSNGINENNSELGYYGHNPHQVPRGFTGSASATSFTAPWYTITQDLVANGAGCSASVVIEVCEPLFLSPLYFGKGEQSGIIGIQNLIVQLQFSELSRMWCHDNESANHNTISTYSTAVNTLEILVKQLTPDSLAKIPSFIPYPYSQITSYPAGNFKQLTSGASGQFSSGSITLNSIPTRMYIFARQQNDDLTTNSTDSFASLEQITIQLGTRQLLSAATPNDLYNISRRNGCNMSWHQWHKSVGSVLAIDLTKDIGLQPTEAPGLLTRSSLVVTANMKNYNNNTINYILYVLICEEGTISIDNGHMLKSVGVLTQADILSAENAPEMPYKNNRNIYGGAIWDDVWSGVKSAYKFVKDDVVPVAADVYKAYKTVTGSGVSGGRESEARDNRMMQNKMMNAVAEGGARRKRGGGLVGARMISREDL